MKEDQLILIDDRDAQIGVMGKLETHQKGLLHRAFSIFVGNDKGELMLQQRAAAKYHCGNLWTNTCCGHPRDGEALLQAAHRRLREEMGFDCALRETFAFQYKVAFENGLWENEITHVFFGRYNSAPILNPDEADAWKWIKTADVRADILNNSAAYTYWFQEALKEMEKRGLDFPKTPNENAKTSCLPNRRGGG